QVRWRCHAHPATPASVLFSGVFRYQPVVGASRTRTRTLQHSSLAPASRHSLAAFKVRGSPVLAPPENAPVCMCAPPSWTDMWSDLLFSEKLPYSCEQDHEAERHCASDDALLAARQASLPRHSQDGDDAAVLLVMARTQPNQHFQRKRTHHHQQSSNVWRWPRNISHWPGRRVPPRACACTSSVPKLRGFFIEEFAEWEFRVMQAIRLQKVEDEVGFLLGRLADPLCTLMWNWVQHQRKAAASGPEPPVPAQGSLESDGQGVSSLDFLAHLRELMEPEARCARALNELRAANARAWQQRVGESVAALASRLDRLYEVAGLNEVSRCQSLLEALDAELTAGVSIHNFCDYNDCIRFFMNKERSLASAASSIR
ncbi:hypothetical protein KEM52_000531, partial [Ascosphaera acerosa]